MTDGKGVSITLKKPKLVRTEPLPPKMQDYDTILGLDPGRRDLFTAVDQDDHFYRYSTAQYYEEAKFKQSNYKIANWYKRDEEVLDYVRNMPAKKTASLDTLVQYLNYLLPKLDVLLEWHMRPRMKNLKFKRF